MKTKEDLIRFAQYAAANPTPTERLTLNCLESLLGPNGIAFEFQKIFGFYILDFVIPSRLLVIEIDGPEHQNNRNRKRMDTIRDRFCLSCGLKTLRIKTEEFNQLPFLIQQFPEVQGWENKWLYYFQKAEKKRKEVEMKVVIEKPRKKGKSHPEIGRYYRNLRRNKNLADSQELPNFGW
jgi:very-short-patch-repair endonuclease